MRRAALFAAALLSGCIATQEEPPATQQAERYLVQLAKKLPPGTSLESALGQLRVDGFTCREAAARPMPMGHTIVCSHATQQAWGVVLHSDNEQKVKAIRHYERTAPKP